MGMTQGLLSALVADAAPANLTRDRLRRVQLRERRSPAAGEPDRRFPVGANWPLGHLHGRRGLHGVRPLRLVPHPPGKPGYDANGRVIPLSAEVRQCPSEIPTSARWSAATPLRDSRHGDLADLLDDAINPLRSLVTGGRLDLSAMSMPEELIRFAALTFEGVLTCDQIVVVPNRTQWWWVQNGTTGPFALKVTTPLGAPSIAIPQGSAWQLVQCDGNDNIVLSPAHIQRTFGADGRFGANKARALTEIFHVTRVPMDRICDELGFEVGLLVEDAILEQRIRNLKRRKEMRGPFKRIAHLRRELVKALDELDDEIFYASGFDRVSIVGALTVLLDVPIRHLATSRPKNRASN